jgi:hypothetical protein
MAGRCLMDAFELVWRIVATAISLGVGFAVFAILTNSGR